MKKRFTTISITFFILVFIIINPNILSKSSIDSTSANTLRLEAENLPEFLRRARTRSFIELTRSTIENNASSLDQLFFKIGSLQILDPLLTNLSSAEKSLVINQILLLQNTDNGFGGWIYDQSALSTTFQAVQLLYWLGDTTLDKPSTKIYLDSLQNSLTYGFVSNKYDSDSDLYSTSLAVETYNLLGFSPPNASKVIDVIKHGQNLNDSISVEEGGFGLQTNYLKSIYWNSSGIATRAALFALADLSSQAINETLALNFLKQLQSTSGGFTDIPYTNGDITGPYTTSILEGIYHLNGTPTNTIAATNYLLSLENTDGGFKLKELSTQSSYRGTYYALKGLKLLGSSPTDINKTINFLLQEIYSDGYGGTPGESPSLRETFDAVAALKLMNKDIPNNQSITDYVASYRNQDGHLGGYGLKVSNMDSTSRAVIIYDLLGIPFPNPSETLTFVKNLQQSNGGFSKSPSDSRTYVISTYRALRILEILGGTPNSLSGAANYVVSQQNPDGGFGGFSGDTSDVTTTYRAVRALSILNNTNYDRTAVKQFILNSQVQDGGFKRSPSEINLPKNVSNLIHTYSASQIMTILNFVPNNVSSMYDFVLSTRNTDGGFAEHPHFTSNIAYTYTALWILRNFQLLSDFSILIPDNLNIVRSQYKNFQLELKGKLGPMNYTVTDFDTNTVLTDGVNKLEGIYNVDTSSLSIGTHNLHIEAVDQSFARIDSNIILNIFEETLSNTSTSSSVSTTPAASSLTIFSTLFAFVFSYFLINRKKNRK